MTITYLKKANDDVISFCECGDGRITFPPQMDCPWCGCGWLFTCITCRKAFTFAEGVEMTTTWEELARGDLRNGWNKEPTREEVEGWIAAMKEMLDGVKPGEQYVIIDGRVISVDAKKVSFDGWHAHHELVTLPQVEARSDKSILDAHLGSRPYWSTHALEEYYHRTRRGSE